MAGQPISKARKDRTIAWLAGDDRLTAITDRIRNGATLKVILAGNEETRLDYGMVYSWIQDDSERRALYLAAIDARDSRGKDQVVQRWGDWITSDVVDLFDSRGCVKPIDQMTAAARRSIAAMEVEERFDREGVHTGRLVRIKVVDIARIVEVYAKHLKMLTDKVEHTGSMSLEQLLDASNKAAPLAKLLPPASGDDPSK